MRAGAIAGVFAVILLGLAGCASEVVRSPAQLSGAQPSPARYQLIQPVEVLLDSGYQRKIESGTELELFGRVPQGHVFRPTNTVLTVEGAHVHEAYPVLVEGRLVGFYLPFEKAFAPLSRPVPFSIRAKGD